MQSLHQNKNRASPRVNSWLVSFGDLLTLLLCFFISVVASSPLNPDVKSNPEELIPRNVEGIPDSSFIRAQYNFSGTAIAKLDHEPLTSPLEFLETDFVTDSSGEYNELRESAKEKLKFAVNQEDYVLEGATVETCSGAKIGKEGAAEGAQWHLAMSRALALKGQVLDSGAGVVDVKLRILGPHCEILKSENGDFVSRIFLRTRKENG